MRVIYLRFRYKSLIVQVRQGQTRDESAGDVEAASCPTTLTLRRSASYTSNVRLRHPLLRRQLPSLRSAKVWGELSPAERDGDHAGLSRCLLRVEYRTSAFKKPRSGL